MVRSDSYDDDRSMLCGAGSNCNQSCPERNAKKDKVRFDGIQPDPCNGTINRLSRRKQKKATISDQGCLDFGCPDVAMFRFCFDDVRWPSLVPLRRRREARLVM